MQTGLGLVLRRGGDRRAVRANGGTLQRVPLPGIEESFYGEGASDGASDGQIDWQSETAYDAREQE
jgi:hypothetical protein